MDVHAIAMRRPSPARLLLASLFSVLSACAGAPPAPPQGSSHPSVASPAPPPLLPSRWIEQSGATLLGPRIERGTLVLLGGRRALVGDDGNASVEKAPSPEPLEEIVAVPTAAGQRLIGRSNMTVYRLDDPLGAPTPLARSDTPIGRIGAGPGVIAIWTARSDLPLFIDAETGAPKPLAGLPPPPLRAIAFLDAKRGAAVFEAAGLAVTTDGGVSWKIAADSGQGDVLRMNGIRRRGDALRAFIYNEGPDAAIDVTGARVSALEQPQVPPNEAPLLRWIRLTGRDPLAVAAASGLEAAAGGALLASHGLLARVDLKTGSLLDLTEFARGKWMTPCTTARAGQTAWVACTLSENQANSDLYDPFGVFSIPLGGTALKAERPALIRNGEAEFAASPSGGAMLVGACNADDDGKTAACVRQPNGTWAPIHLDLDLNGRGAGPTADGRLAFLRGIFDGDEAPDAAPEPRAAPPPAGGDDEDGTRLSRVRVILVDPAGKEQSLAPINIPTTSGEVRIQSSIEEQSDRSLHFVIDGGGGIRVVIQPPGNDAATVQPIRFATVARIRGGRGIAVGEGHVLASLDGGNTWSDVPAPPRVMETASAVGSNVDGWTQIDVSEIGARVGSVLRVGWGPSEPAPEPAPAPAAPRLEVAKVPPAGPEKLLVCKSEGPAQGTPPLLGSTQLRALLASKPPAKGTRREVSSGASGRAGMLDTIALLEEEGPDSKGSRPALWSLKWHDPTEIGGKPRAAKVKVPALALAAAAKTAGKPSAAPREMPWGASLRFAAASGPRALFTLRAGGKNLLVRAQPSGAAAVAEAPTELLPSGEVVFGADKGEPIAWMHEASLVVWLAGEAPRAIASITTHAVRSLGQPTPDGIPVMLGSNDWALSRTVPIPAFDPKAGAKPPSPAALSLDGWRPVANVRRDLGSIAACTPKSSGARFIVQRSRLEAQIDGASEAGSLALYDIRASSAEACVAAVSGFLSPDRRGAAPEAAPPPKKKGAPTAAESSGPVAFLRADLTGKRAEGGDRGVPPAVMRRLGCTLRDRP
jgi:hypothetical protein